MKLKQRGFTLVEVLVALVIMAIMAVMAWQGIDGIVRTRDASQARLEQVLRFNTVLTQWEQDLSTIQDAELMGAEPLKCDSVSVRFVRRAQGGLQVVAWSLRPQGNSNVLVRWASPVATQMNALQESYFRSLQLQGEEPGTLRTLTGLTSWQVYFFRGGWTNAQSSGDLANVTTTGLTESPRGIPPKGVRVVLSFAPDSGVSGSLTRDIQLGPP
jgi:general secretion pathway protein J